MIQKFFLSFSLALLLFGCSSSGKIGDGSLTHSHFGIKGKYTGHYKIGAPYNINGQHHVPEKNELYEEVGHASWYGGGKDKFHGKKTANGIQYDARAMTAAHRTLPMPSVVEVTNLSNNKSVLLMVTDRGPFIKKRIIDVSEKAAEMLGMKAQGVAKVRVKLLPHHTKELLANLKMDEREGSMPGSSKKTKPRKSVQFAKSKKKSTYLNSADAGSYIHIGKFAKRDEAGQIANDVAHLGSVNIKTVKVNNRALYKVTLGPVHQAHAQDLLTAVKNVGHQNASIILAEAR